MRIQLASDLHLDFLREHFPGERLIVPAPSADLLVLAGDIANDTQGIRLFAEWPVPVLYVLGNHEAYGTVLNQVRHAIRRAAQGTSVVLLDNDCADFSRFEGWTRRHAEELKRIRFLGCTLWTNYQLPLAALSGRRAMDYAEQHLTDHRIIQTETGAPFSPREALREHEASVS